MKPFRLLFIFLTLLLSGVASASSNDVGVTPAPFTYENATPNNVWVDTINQTYTISPEPGVNITSPRADNSNKMVGVQMVKEGIESVIVDNVNGVFVSVGGLQLGELNNTEQDPSKVAIFAIAAHTIDPTKDPAMMDRINTMKDLYRYSILIFAAILAIFLIYQSLDPDDAAKILETATGNYGYVSSTDMVKYFVNTCGWLLLGPAIFFGSIKINNFLVEGQMLSILDQVAFSSDNIGLYIIMGILWLLSIIFFAIRLVFIIIGAHLWIMYGLGFALKKIRWAAILTTVYQIVFIFAQFTIVWVCCVIVSYTASTELAWYSVSFVYLGLLLTVVFMEILFVFWPFIWKLLSPRTLTTAIKFARYI